MYLTHTELLKIHKQVIFGDNRPNHKFDPSKQIRVCSIDIRVDNIFWVTKKRRQPINLGATKIFEVSPRRLWKKVKIEDNGSIKLKPGDMILGRTCEKINMPNNLVGKINTRSSYARLGISTACNCDLINPGYEGYVPLEITNTTPNTFLIHPYLPLCQIFIMELSGDIDSSYSSEKYKSKYMDDDGGPSVWWRDELVLKISKQVLKTQISNNAIDELRDKFENIDDNGLYRLEQFIESKQFDNSEELLNGFKGSENKRHKWYRNRRTVSLWAFPTFVVLFLLQLQTNILPDNKSIDVITYIILGITIAGFFPFLWYSFKTKVRFYND